MSWLAMQLVQGTAVCVLNLWNACLNLLKANCRVHRCHGRRSLTSIRSGSYHQSLLTPARVKASTAFAMAGTPDPDI